MIVDRPHSPVPHSGRPPVKGPAAISFPGRAFLFLFLLSTALMVGCSESAPEHPLVMATDGEIRIAVSGVDDGKVHFFTYKKLGRNINFFVRTNGLGNLSTHFDACYTCYRKKKGYRQEGTDLICNECGLRFRLSDEKWLHEGCSPVPLASRLDKGSIFIRTADLEAGERLF